MKDVLLTADGDLYVNEMGDISLTDSIRQAVRIRLQWFLNEWRFAPEFGLPYLDEILVKSPNIDRIRRIVRDEAASVDEVIDVRNISITVDKPLRATKISFDLITDEVIYREEVFLHV